MAAGMNWGIFSLLAVIVTVLGGIAAFFVFLARRAAKLAAAPAAKRLLEPADAAGPHPWRAAVFGRSDVPKRWGLGTLLPARPVGACGARSRAQAGPAVFGGSPRAAGSGSTGSDL